MSSGGSEKPQWKFDPNTGEPVMPASETPAPQEPQAPTYRASAEQGPYQQQPAPEYTPTPSAAPTQPYTYNPQPPAQPGPQQGYQSQPQYTTPVPAQPAPTPKRASRAPLIAGLIALVLLVAAGGGALYLWQNVINRPAVSVERLLPTNTLAYLTFDPVLEGQQKAAMDSLREAFEAQPGFKEAWANMTGQFTESLGDGTSDQATPDPANLDTLATYLGNSITLAMLAPSSTDLEKLKNAGNMSGSEDVVGDVMGRNVAAIVDLDFNPLNKKGPISDLKTQVDNAGKAELVETYRNVEIRKFTTEDGDNEVYFALLDGSSTAIVGQKPDPLRVLIDGFRDNKTLNEDATFKALSGQVPQDRIGAVYVNLSEIYKQIQLAAPEVLEGQSLQNLSGAMMMTLSAATDGIQLDVASETDLSLMDTSFQVNPDARPDPATINDVPNGTTAFYAGTDLKTTLEAMLKNLRSNTDMGSEIDSQIKSMEDALGINMEQDLIPLLGGDYVVSLSLDSRGDNPSPSVVFQLKLSEPDKMKSLLKRAVGDNPDANAETFETAGGTFYGDEFSGMMLGVTQDRFWFIFDADRQAAEARLQSAVDSLGKGFGTSTDWNGAKGHLARDSNAIVYANLASIRQFVESSFVDPMDGRADYDKNVGPFVKPLKYFLVGSATQAAKNGTLSRNHTVIFLGISK